MFHNREDFTESAHIGQELFNDNDYELERQCMAAQSVIKNGICTFDEALRAYNVTSGQYFKYLGKSESSVILLSLSDPEKPLTPSLVKVYVTMIEATWALPAKQRKKISEILLDILEEKEIRPKLDAVK